jgi:hypothetical protein
VVIIKSIKLVNNKIEITREIKTELSPEEVEDQINVLSSIKAEYLDKIANIDNELEVLTNFKSNNKKLFDDLKLQVANITKS